MQADFGDGLPFEDESFDTIIDTMTFSSVFDRTVHAQEMKRLCKPNGLILLMERGSSYLSIYNEWLKFKAARDLFDKGQVEHLDFEKIIETNFSEFDVVHKERRNLGMTTVCILRKRAETDAD